MKLEKLQVYQLSMDLGERVWEIVIKSDYFSKDTIGKQFVRAVDSIAANLSEGFGRYYYKENKQFCYYSRGSLHETLTWLTKTKNRGLINVEDFHSIRKDIDTLGLKLNNYIRSIGKRETTSDRMTNDDSEAEWLLSILTAKRSDLMTNNDFINVPFLWLDYFSSPGASLSVF